MRSPLLTAGQPLLHRLTHPELLQQFPVAPFSFVKELPSIVRQLLERPGLLPCRRQLGLRRWTSIDGLATGCVAG